MADATELEPAGSTERGSDIRLGADDGPGDAGTGTGTGPLVLVVDDEADIRDLAAAYLRRDGFRVAEAADGTSALSSAAARPPDLVVLDLMLPGIDGWEVCRRLRRESSVPIIMLTARGDPVDRVVGLELGADDYVVKPFDGRELVARIRAVLRRTHQANDDGTADSPGRALAAPVAVGDVVIDPARRSVTVDGVVRQPRARVFDLLAYFARNVGLVLTRDVLLENVWGYDFLGDSRTVDVHIAHARSTIADSRSVRIETVWSVGYKLVLHEPAAPAADDGTSAGEPRRAPAKKPGKKTNS